MGKIRLASGADFAIFLSRMKTKPLVFSLLMGFAVLAPVVRADETPLAKQMESMDDAFKAFRRETDPAKGAALAREAQEAVVAGMKEMPAKLAKMPAGAEKDKAAAAYRKSMAKLLLVFCEVEEAFLAGKLEEVEKQVAAVREMKKEGHDQFMED
jgi:soluble cytochrome b562